MRRGVVITTIEPPGGYYTGSQAPADVHPFSTQSTKVLSNLVHCGFNSTLCDCGWADRDHACAAPCYEGEQPQERVECKDEIASLYHSDLRNPPHP